MIKFVLEALRVSWQQCIKSKFTVLAHISILPVKYPSQIFSHKIYFKQIRAEAIQRQQPSQLIIRLICIHAIRLALSVMVRIRLIVYPVPPPSPPRMGFTMADVNLALQKP